MKLVRKMMLVPFKEENDNNEFSSIIKENEINTPTPIKLDLISKKINELKKNKVKNHDDENDNNDLKRILCKNKKLKTIEKLNEISKLLNKRNIKKENIKNDKNRLSKISSIKEINEKEERLIKKPVKRKLPEIIIDKNVGSVDSIKRPKLKNLAITKSENLNIPSESMEIDLDDYDYGTFTRTANKPIFLDNNIITRNNLLKWSKFQ